MRPILSSARASRPAGVFRHTLLLAYAPWKGYPYTPALPIFTIHPSNEMSSSWDACISARGAKTLIRYSSSSFSWSVSSNGPSPSDAACFMSFRKAVYIGVEAYIIDEKISTRAYGLLCSLDVLLIGHVQHERLSSTSAQNAISDHETHFASLDGNIHHALQIQPTRIYTPSFSSEVDGKRRSERSGVRTPRNERDGSVHHEYNWELIVFT